ncbi:hypothetical protein TrVE_jg12795 [Triparma verrucosa]|jgi:acetyl-CoA acyltransferase 2|uniref:Uncharacterized protein n=2 Tax=Triparma TaxID=722752 RepID=A0A9W7A3W1_9STRA|nr:hypothetical protein TrST_g9559 [Triparma strigata]GMI06025.1 hypothetical protein TrVE_jg12795 [Triparma verrucosa]
MSIFVVAAKRTPFGSFGGSLKALSATDLCVSSTKAALTQGNVDPSIVDGVFVGNVIQSSPDAAYLARHVGLKSGVPISTQALTINRLCGSGFETVAQGAQAIQLGLANVTVCGGSENMSAAPMTVDGNAARWGVALGKGMQMTDSLWSGLTDSYAGTPMGVTAENLAKKYNITREECDEYAVRSQQTWGKAKEAGHFDAEMAPIEVKTRKGMVTIDTDEHPKPSTTVEQISKLRPVFDKEGVVTAAGASGICDGAGTIILASEEAVKEHNLTPLCKLTAWNSAGCEPTEMGIGPVPAIKNALAIADRSLSEVDRVEINEAFAAQFLSCAKELNLDMSKTNINGGAISLGHPLGASGSRIVAHLANEFARNDDLNVAVGSACIGGGQGIAVVLERC